MRARLLASSLRYCAWRRSACRTAGHFDFGRPQRLQSPGDGSRMFVSDFFDFSIYMDADDQTIEIWYIERFLRLRETVFRNKDSYFHRYSQLSESEAVQTARKIWEEINLANLRDNIGPTKERAHLILEKGANHRVDNILCAGSKATAGIADGSFSEIPLVFRGSSQSSPSSPAPHSRNRQRLDRFAHAGSRLGGISDIAAHGAGGGVRYSQQR